MVITQAKELRLALIADDSLAARKQIEEILSDNWRIETAENGVQVIDKFSRLRPSVVTLAVKMPIMSGYETLRRILAIDNDAKVVMISSVENVEILRKCFDGGAIAYIVKPFAPEELCDTITIAEKTDKEHRKTIFIFSRMIREIKNVFENVGHIHPTVSLKDVQILHSDQPANVPPPSEMHKIVNVELRSAKSPKIPEGHKGFATEIMMRNGPSCRIITWIKLDSLARIRENYIKKVEMPYDQTLECIEIFHDRVAAQISVATGFLADIGDMKPVEVSGDDYDKYYQEMHEKVDSVFAKYEISYKDVVVPLEVHLYFNIHMLFRNRF